MDKEKGNSTKPGESEPKKVPLIDSSAFFLLLTIFCNTTIYGLASPFLPVELENKGVSSGMTGMVFAIYAVTSVISSFFWGKYLDKVGHRFVISGGVLLMASAIATFGLIEKLDDKNLVLAMALGLRSIQGVASGMINTACFSFIAQSYPENMERLIGLAEGVCGIGCTLGPVLGAFVYNAVGFSDTFFIFGAAISPFAFIIGICLKKPGSQQAEEEEENEDGGPDLLNIDGTIEV